MNQANPRRAAPLPFLPPYRDSGWTEAEEEAEARGLESDDYSSRAGYQTGFLGRGFNVPLPRPQATLRPHLLAFMENGRRRTLLHYTHFSVLMHRARRMCIYSAVNIDGLNEKAEVDDRTGWRFDPRLPRDFQIKAECYGRESEGKFSRGHMTRREDPNWGELPVAQAANRDTFHVTNACPQWQPFNGGVWLGLEDYALQNARERDIRISVFTGPVFGVDDPRFFGVSVPLAFWKVIAFIHGETNRLCATGYLLQAELPDTRDLDGAPFGAYKTYQRAISEIEELSQLSFGKLTALDPLAGARSLEVEPLERYREIQFV